MTFSFNQSLGNNLSLVRFHIGDTNGDGYYLEDETISALVISEGSVGAAVVSCIKYIIVQLSQPDFRLDWLSVSNSEARKGFQELLKQKAQEFGVSVSGVVATSTVTQAHRADSFENEDGEYTEADGT